MADKETWMQLAAVTMAVARSLRTAEPQMSGQQTEAMDVDRIAGAAAERDGVPAREDRAARASLR